MITSGQDEQTARLARRAREGSTSAFAALVRIHQGHLYNFLLRRVTCAADAADLAQETFLRAWQRIDRYDPDRPFTTWLYTLGVRATINLHRTGARRVRLTPRAAPPHAAEDPAAPVVRREEAGRLWALADRALSPDQRTALWLRYAEGLDIADIARVLDKTRLATRVMLFRAREKLAGLAAAAPSTGPRHETRRRGPTPAATLETVP